MSDNKDKPKFQRHDIPRSDSNPAHELAALYNESETIEKTQHETDQKSPEMSFQRIIQENRDQRRKSLIIFSIIGLFICASAAIAGFLFFAKPDTSSTDNIKITIAAPDTVKVNQSFDYAIDYQNLGIDLKNARLDLQYPTGFVLEKSDPAITNREWTIGDITTYQTGKLTLTGHIVDDVSNAHTLTATLNFYPSNFNSEFSKTVSQNITLAAPDIELAIDFPATVGIGADMPIAVTIKNKEGKDFIDLKLVMKYPADFTFQSASPKADESNNAWRVAKVSALKNNQPIQIDGTFPANLTFANDEARQRDFTAEIYMADAQKQYHLIGQEQFSTKLIDQAVSLYLNENGATGTQNVKLGDTLTFTLNAANNGKQTYQNVQIKTIITNNQSVGIFDWTKLNDKNSGTITQTNSGKVIVWSKSQISKLASFTPGTKQTITFSLPLKSANQFKATDYKALADANLTVSSEIIFSDATPTIQSNTLNFNIASNITLDAKVMAHDSKGKVIGTGPLPPQVNKTTKLQTIWTITNDLHDLENVSVSTVLPAQVNWDAATKSVSIGDMSYETTTRKLTWTIPSWSQTKPTATASFMINILPMPTDAGKILTLTSSTLMSAKDSDTGDVLTATAKPLTSYLEQDKYDKTTGVVQK